MYKGILLLLFLIHYTHGTTMLIPLSKFDSDTSYPNLTFSEVPYLYIASDDSVDYLKKIKFVLPDPETGDEPSKTAFSISTLKKQYNTVVDQKKPWNGSGVEVAVESKLKKEEAALLRGVLYVTTDVPDADSPVFDAWRIPAAGTPFEFKVASTAIFLNNAPATVSLLSNFTVTEGELSILSGVPGSSTSTVLATYKSDTNATVDPIFLMMRSFTVKTTGKAQFWLGGNAVEESKRVKTSASSGVLVSYEYPDKSGITAEQNVTYDRRMNFSVTGTFQLNENEYVLMKLRNVNTEADITTQKVTASGTVNIAGVAEQLVIQPSSMRAGAFLISYSTEDSGDPQSPTGATGKPESSTESGEGTVKTTTTATKGSTSIALSFGLIFVTTTLLR